MHVEGQQEALRPLLPLHPQSWGGMVDGWVHGWGCTAVRGKCCGVGTMAGGGGDVSEGEGAGGGV